MWRRMVTMISIRRLMTITKIRDRLKGTTLKKEGTIKNTKTTTLRISTTKITTTSRKQTNKENRGKKGITIMKTMKNLSNLFKLINLMQISKGTRTMTNPDKIVSNKISKRKITTETNNLKKIFMNALSTNNMTKPNTLTLSKWMKQLNRNSRTI